MLDAGKGLTLICTDLFLDLRAKRVFGHLLIARGEAVGWRWGMDPRKQDSHYYAEYQCKIIA